MATFQLIFQSGRAKDLSAPLYIWNLTMRGHWFRITATEESPEGLKDKRYAGRDRVFRVS